jgi:uncharacterized Tic20 family protein
MYLCLTKDGFYSLFLSDWENRWWWFYIRYKKYALKKKGNCICHFSFSLTFPLHVSCSLIIYVYQHNKVKLVNSTQCHAMYFSRFLSLLFFFLSIWKWAKQKINDLFNDLVKTKKRTTSSMFAHRYTEKKIDERWAELCQLSTLFSLLFFLLFLCHQFLFWCRQQQNKGEGDDNFCVESNTL